MYVLTAGINIRVTQLQVNRVVKIKSNISELYAKLSLVCVCAYKFVQIKAKSLIPA